MRALGAVTAIILVCVTLIGVAQGATFGLRRVTREHRTNLPVHGNVYPLGVYYTQITIGTPPVAFNVSIDTGSTDTLVPGVSCAGCAVTSTRYSAAKSSTARPLDCGSHPDVTCPLCLNHGTTCGFKDTYVTCAKSDPNKSCSVGGPLHRDIVCLGEHLCVDAVIGEIAEQDADFYQFSVIDGTFATPWRCQSC